MGNQTLCILSGKGGAGKTVLGLSMARVLAEAGISCLFVDCDVATHGATYFFEAELGEVDVTSLADLLKSEHKEPIPLNTKFGFSFLPSTLSPENDDFRQHHRVPEAFKAIALLAREYDACILDCHAGFSQVVLQAAGQSDKNLIVLEPDAISSAALRVLSLQLGAKVSSSNTWQIFNKLTEEERIVYEKIFGGTLFPNLPPIPFDWQVRAAFSTREIPGVLSESSAFGLGVLRVMKTLFPGRANELKELENRTVGKWYEKISNSLKALELQKEELALIDSKVRKIKTLRQTQFAFSGFATVAILALLIGLMDLFPLKFPVYEELTQRARESSGLWLVAAGVGMMFFSFYFYLMRKKQFREEEINERHRESLSEIESEISRYRTLVFSDPRLREQYRIREANTDL